MASRVKTVYIHPHFLSTIKEPPPQSTYTRRLAELAHLLAVPFGKQRQYRDRSLCFKSSEDVVSAMTSVLSSLPNITDYHIAWSGLESIRDLPVPILTAPFGKAGLTRLWMDISLERLSSLLSSESFRGFGRLHELDLFLRVEHPQEEEGESFHDILTLLAHSLPCSLTHLSIRLWQPLDLSPLFESLFLPSLTHLKLDIPLSVPHMGPPKSLGGWISSHSHSLTNLTIRASQLHGPGYTPLDSSLSIYFRDLVPEIQLRRLDTLDIGLSHIPFPSALSLIHHLGGGASLKTLSLTGTQLSFTQLHSLLSSPSLTTLDHLKLGTIGLSVEVLDILSSQIPSLKSLTLFIRDILPSQYDVPLWWGGTSGGGQEESQIDAFLDRVSSPPERYHHWHLETMRIVRGVPFSFSSTSSGGGSTSDARELGWETMNERFEIVLRDSIPGLKTVDVGIGGGPF